MHPSAWPLSCTVESVAKPRPNGNFRQRKMGWSWGSECHWQCPRRGHRSSSSSRVLHRAFYNQTSVSHIEIGFRGFTSGKGFRTCSPDGGILQPMGHGRYLSPRYPHRTGWILGWCPTRGVGHNPDVPMRRQKKCLQFANCPRFWGRSPQRSQYFHSPYRMRVRWRRRPSLAKIPKRLRFLRLCGFR